jgi:hypothetical protein
MVEAEKEKGRRAAGSATCRLGATDYRLDASREAAAAVCGSVVPQLPCGSVMPLQGERQLQLQPRG